MSNSDIQERAVRLLAKADGLSLLAASASDEEEALRYEREAETYLAKATELMTEDNIRNAMVSLNSDKAITEVFYVVPEYVPRKLHILGRIARVFDCRVVTATSKLAANNYGIAEPDVFGFKDEIESVKRLYVATIQLGERGSNRRRVQGNKSRGYHADYWTGFGEGVLLQLTRAKEEVTKTAVANDPSTSLVLRNRQSEVDRVMRSKYPYLKSSKLQIRSAAGYHAGISDGKAANISGKNTISAAGQKMLGR